MYPFLEQLYGPQAGQAAFEQLCQKLDHFSTSIGPGMAPRSGSLTHQDALLITYADQVSEPGKKPLATLADFAEKHLTGILSGMHILPFFPSTSDDGFAVVDYSTVYQDWEPGRT